MPIPQHLHSAVTYNDKIYIIGGIGDSIMGKVQVYDTNADSWETKASMPTPRYGLGLAVVGDKIYACGGGDKNYKPLPNVEVYDPQTDQWKECTPMPTARRLTRAAAIGNRIYVVGGSISVAGGHPVLGVVEEGVVGANDVIIEWSDVTRGTNPN